MLKVKKNNEQPRQEKDEYEDEHIDTIDDRDWRYNGSG